MKKIPVTAAESYSAVRGIFSPFISKLDKHIVRLLINYTVQIGLQVFFFFAALSSPLVEDI